MDQEKNNKGVIIILGVIIVILATLCVLFATNTISLSNKESDNTTTDKTSVENDTTDTTNNTTTDNLTWTQYILSQDITKIEVITTQESTTISLDNLKEILPNFDNTKLIKTWYYSMGADATATDLKISYKNNDNEYVLSIATAKHDSYSRCTIYKGHEIMDKSLSDIFENSIVEEKNADMKESGTYFYEFDGCDGSMLQKYISNNKSE